MPPSRSREWLEADGLGGFASGTASGTRTRRYHALLLSATTPPTGRVVLVNGFDAVVTTASGTFALSSQRYLPDVQHPDGESRLQTFELEPWPTWRYRLEDGRGHGSEIVQEIVAWHGRPVVAVSFRLEGGNASARLSVRPFLSGRDYHGLHHENDAFRFEATRSGEKLAWHPYSGLPPIACITNGEYRHEPLWYRNFLYEAERERGLDFSEDLASPGEIAFDLAPGDEAVCILSSDPGALEGPSAASTLASIRRDERKRRKAFPSRLHRAADAYLVRRRDGSTIVAGYPWFTDWGRDTFIALRGLCLAGGRRAEAESILLEWADAVSEGMLPNRFPDKGEAPEYNSVDASLWYVVAVRDFLKGARKAHPRLSEACHAIVDGYARGTRYGIREDDDGLLACGEPGAQLTWMDAKVGDWVITPRIGKPVEVQALWLNARAFSKAWKRELEKGLESFRDRFWYEEGGYLYDVVDVDHVPGAVDSSLRPNQIFAVGGLPDVVLRDTAKARSVVETLERKLWTPMGLRSLSPDDPRYVPRYEGGVLERDGSYHQGTVWPWLAGAFVDAWERVYGTGGGEERFLGTLLETAEAASGHLPEIADAEPPHAPKGCPFQAWSVGEVLRVTSERRRRSKAKTRSKAAPRRGGRPPRPPSPHA